MKKKPELLLPVGGKEQLKAAVENGADALYLGGSVFSARQYAENFNSAQLKEAIEYAHIRDVNVYLTMNTLLHDPELEIGIENVLEAYKYGIDAIIVQDLGLARLIRKYFPDLPMHLSTEATVYNTEGVKKAEELGFSRVVLARELSLKEIQEISNNTRAELEVFVHGALCISYSGQCLMSSFIGGRSGNRGTCAQPCRLKYQLLMESQGEYKSIGKQEHLISPKDLCGIDMINKLMDLNVTSFKIEGRMKSAEYVAEVTKAYRRYLDMRFEKDYEDVDQQTKKDLLQVYNRGGFSKGYLECDPIHDKTFIANISPKHRGIPIGKVIKYNKKSSELNIELEDNLAIGDIIEVQSEEFAGGRVTYMENAKRQSISEAHCKEIVFVKSVKGEFSEGEIIYKIIDIHLNKALQRTYSKENIRKTAIEGFFVAKEGQPLKLEIRDKKNKVEIISEYQPEKAINMSTTKESILKQLNKTGATPFTLSHCQVYVDDALSIRASEINDIRRKALEKLEEMKKDKYPNRKMKEISYRQRSSYALKRAVEKSKISLFMWNLIKGFEKLDVDRIYINFNEILKSDFQNRIKEVDASKEIILWIPGLTRGYYDKFIKENIDTIAGLEIDGIMVGNLGQIHMLKDSNHNLYGDSSLNVFNGETLRELKKMGLRGVALSNELNMEDIEELAQDEFELEATVYGQLPMMTMEYCPIGKRIRNDEVNKCNLCRNNKYYLLDRMDKRLPLITDTMDCRVTLLNGDKIAVPDMIIPLKERGISVFRLYVYDESFEEMESIIKEYKKAMNIESKGYKREKGFTAGHYKRGV